MVMRAGSTKPHKPETVTLKELASAVSGMHGFPAGTMNGILGDFVQKVVSHLERGDRVRVTGLGVLQVRNRPARQGRNPATGETMQLKASRKLSFRTAKALKDRIQ